MSYISELLSKLTIKSCPLDPVPASVLSATFDTVDHLILLNRLGNCFGICGSALAWFKSSLSDRFHVVDIQGAPSAMHPLSWGVPQGSVLGPILCLLYTSPLGDIVRWYNMGFHFYTDVTCRNNQEMSANKA